MVERNMIPFALKKQFGVDFINILRAAFTFKDPKSVKNTIKPSVFFVLLGSAGIKASHKMLVKLTPGQQKRRHSRDDRQKKAFCHSNMSFVWLDHKVQLKNPFMGHSNNE